MLNSSINTIFYWNIFPMISPPRLLLNCKNICEIKLYDHVGPDSRKNLYCSDKKPTDFVGCGCEPRPERIIYYLLSDRKEERGRLQYLLSSQFDDFPSFPSCLSTFNHLTVAEKDGSRHRNKNWIYCGVNWGSQFVSVLSLNNQNVKTWNNESMIWSRQ